MMTLSVGQLDVPEHGPLVFVAGVGAFEGDRLGARLQHDAEDLLERDVAVVRPFVVAPAQVQAQAVGGDVPERVVERFDIGLGDLHELSRAEVGEGQMAPHRQVRAIDLEHESGLVDGVVLLLHDVGQVGQIGLTARVVLVAQEMRDDAGRGGGHERLGAAAPRTTPL